MVSQAAVDIITNHHVDTTFETDPVNGATVKLIERDEGDVLHAYRDIVGVWTIGYGHTGPEVTPGLVIDQAQAEALLRADLAKFEDAVDDLVGDSDTTDNQFGALVSLVYNVGPGALENSALIAAHKAGNHQGAAAAFVHYNHAGGRVVAALTRRRLEESALYLTPDPA